MLHRLEGVSDQGLNQKQGGEGVSSGSRKEEPKASVNPVVKKEPKLKEKLFSEEPIIDNEEEEVPDEEELKRRKVREAKLDEHQRIIQEAEEKERAEKVTGPIKTDSFPNAKFKVAREHKYYHQFPPTTTPVLLSPRTAGEPTSPPTTGEQLPIDLEAPVVCISTILASVIWFSPPDL
ncbi:unnamed protein product [Lactuca virosa]|uniref:Uncharacterized protein n=1 Tax=Lactuca virosa TaxID=75947 RepID=A0AAU9LID2_9ASTR|nr:unnamed protein product [Lactuca virosa]